MTAALALRDVSVRIDGATVLARIDWTVAADQRWVVLGPNGAGKTTLLRLAAMDLHPSTGTVEVLGEQLGTTDVRFLKRRIGLASPAIADQVRPAMSPLDLVCSAIYGALVPWWIMVTEDDRRRSAAQLERFGVLAQADQPFATLSSGERQRVLLARALVTDPALVLLDEPMAGLDLGAREALIADLGALAADPAAPATVLITHHAEEIPPAYTHALIIEGGSVVSAGAIDAVLTAEGLEAAFGVRLRVRRRGDRWQAGLRP